MNKWLYQLNRLAKNVDARKRSEKVLILAIVLSGLVLAWLSLVSDPLSADLRALRAQVNSTTRQIEAQRQAHTAMMETTQEDPDRFATERLEAVNRELAQLETQIQELAGDLVTPAQMTRILVDVLEQQDGLQLVSFRNLAAMPLRTGVSNSQAAAGEDNGESVAATISGQVYEHGLVLDFQGDFFATLRYLRYLEDMTGSFFWDSISFRRLEWPMAQVSLQIHTLSTDRGFIGV